LLIFITIPLNNYPPSSRFAGLRRDFAPDEARTRLAEAFGEARAG